VTKGIGVQTHDQEGRVITAEYKNCYLVATYIPNSGRKDKNSAPWPNGYPTNPIIPNFLLSLLLLLLFCFVPFASRLTCSLDKRMEWDVAFQAYLQGLDKLKPVVLCGDLNVWESYESFI
jgi:exodeoxyribonuclease-3